MKYPTTTKNWTEVERNVNQLFRLGYKRNVYVDHGMTCKQVPSYKGKRRVVEVSMTYAERGGRIHGVSYACDQCSPALLRRIAAL